MSKFNKKSVLLVLVLLIVFSSIAFGQPLEGLYASIKAKLEAIANVFTSKDSALVESGDNAQAELKAEIDKVEEEIMAEVSKYEKEQIAEANRVLIEKVAELKALIQADKGNITNEIKEKIKNKIDKDLEKELKKLEIGLEE